MTNAARRTYARPGAARAATARLGRWRRCAVRGAVALAAAALAGCAGLPGPMAPGTDATTGSTPAPGTTPAPAATAAQNPAAPFPAAVAPVGAARVRLGDPVSFVLSAGAAGYGHLYLLNASGTVVALAEGVALAPGAPVLFPAPGAGFTIRASAPLGANRVLLLVTRRPFAGLGGGGAGAAPVTLAVRAEAFVAQLNAATAGLAPDGWALAEARVEVVAAGG